MGFETLARINGLPDNFIMKPSLWDLKPKVPPMYTLKKHNIMKPSLWDLKLQPTETLMKGTSS